MKITCFNCGKKFIPGNDPRTGVPNGLGFVLKSGKTYNVCSKCVAYRTDEVDAKMTALEEGADEGQN